MAQTTKITSLGREYLRRDVSIGALLGVGTIPVVEKPVCFCRIGPKGCVIFYHDISCGTHLAPRNIDRGGAPLLHAAAAAPAAAATAAWWNYANELSSCCHENGYE